MKVGPDIRTALAARLQTNSGSTSYSSVAADCDGIVATIIRHAVLGNAGTLISFRVGAEDALYLAREFWPRFNEIDLTQLENYHAYLKLIVNKRPKVTPPPLGGVPIAALDIVRKARIA